MSETRRRRVAAVDAQDADSTTREVGIVQSAQAVRGESPFSEVPVLSGGYQRIKETIFHLPDPESEYADLERALVLGTQQFDNVSAALDRAEDNARRAHRLYVCARVEAERFTADADVVEGAMRAQAVAELQREKDAGLRTKQITDSDTTAKLAALFPDEWRDLQARKVESRKMLEHLERFADLWRSRCYSLSKLLESRR